MTADPGIDVLVVSVAGTVGWELNADGLVGALRMTGARVAHARSRPVREVRTLMATDLVQASAARKAALLGSGEHRPEAIVYCSITAALLWDRPGAIWLDATAAENRPGRHGLWQRPLERLRLRQAEQLLLMSPNALDAAGDVPHADTVVVPPVVEPSGPAPAPGSPGAADPPRDIAAITYGADPAKRRLDAVLEAWGAVRRDGEELVVAGLDRPDSDGVRYVGRLAPDEYRALLRRAQVFVTAPRREDYGVAALEALADGAMLVTTPAAGAYPALALAEELDPRLVGDDLAGGLRAALREPRAGYAARAAELVRPYTAEAVAARLSADVLPRLLPGWRG